MEGLSSSITRHFAPLPDPRVERTKEHRLEDILTIALCALLCGADGFKGMETFGQTKAAWLRTFLALPHGIPSHDTFGRVFALLDPELFQACFVAWVQAIAPETLGQVVAIDGKAVRGTFDRARGRAAVHMVSAWASASRLVLGQVAVDEKSNEITAIPALLPLLDLHGAIVTIDAMGCQTAIAEQIVTQQADYILAVKDNQKDLHTDIVNTFTHEREHQFDTMPAGQWDYAKTVGKGHGRVEVREAWTITDPAILAHLDPTQRWTQLRGIGFVESRQYRGEKVTIEQRCYIMSAPFSAATFGAAVRSHWGIENRLHWVLDVTFREDACQVTTGHAAHNLVIARHFALNLLRQDRTDKRSLPQKRFRAALDEHYLTTLLAGLLATSTAVTN